jgi:hypothetical protein
MPFPTINCWAIIARPYGTKHPTELPAQLYDMTTGIQLLFTNNQTSRLGYGYFIKIIFFTSAKLSVANL